MTWWCLLEKLCAVALVVVPIRKMMCVSVFCVNRSLLFFCFGSLHEKGCERQRFFYYYLMPCSTVPLVFSPLSSLSSLPPTSLSHLSDMFEPSSGPGEGRLLLREQDGRVKRIESKSMTNFGKQNGRRVERREEVARFSQYARNCQSRRVGDDRAKQQQ